MKMWGLKDQVKVGTLVSQVGVVDTGNNIAKKKISLTLLSKHLFLILKYVFANRHIYLYNTLR